MSLFTKTPTGFTRIIDNKRVDILSIPSSKAYSVSIEGFERSALKDGGNARDFPHAREIVDAAFPASKHTYEKSSQFSPSKYAPHPQEVRMRMLEVAAKVVGDFFPAATAEDLTPENARNALGTRLRRVRDVAVHLEQFVVTAVADPTEVATPAKPPADADRTNGGS